MKNALIYCTNDNDMYIEKMVNSINSFAFHHPECLDSCCVYVFTESKTPIPLGIDNRVNVQFMRHLYLDYSNAFFRGRFGQSCAWRFEIFSPMFDDFDNVLYLDCDTEFISPAPELFDSSMNVPIGMVRGIGELTTLFDRLHPEMVLQCKTYCNSGMIYTQPKLIDVETRRRICRQLIESISEHGWKYPDQDALNHVLMDAAYVDVVKCINCQYNYCPSTRSVVADTVKILHHTSCRYYDKKFLDVNPLAEKNSVVYITNNNKQYIKKMQNSINSLFENNPSLRGHCTVYVLTDADDLQLYLIDEYIPVKIVNVSLSKYSKFRSRGHWTHHVYMKIELFSNPIFSDIDNLLYLDCDTEVVGDIYNIFTEKHQPMVGMVYDVTNHFERQNIQNSGIYFNAGVIYITPKNISQQTMMQIADDLTKAITLRRWFMLEQDAINYLLGNASSSSEELSGKWKNLSRPLQYGYNCIRNGQSQIQKIIHHVGQADYRMKYIFADNTALVYTDGDLNKMQNSINSFFHFHPQRIENTTVCIFSNRDLKPLLNKLNPKEMKIQIISPIFPYDDFFRGHMDFSKFSKWIDMFFNPKMQDYDNVLVLNTDTVFVNSIDDILVKGNKPRIQAVQESENYLVKQGCSCDCYYNIGVILWNPKWFDDSVSRSLFRAIVASCSSRQWRMGVQDAFNEVIQQDQFKKYMSKLDFKYNAFRTTVPRGYNGEIRLRQFIGNQLDFVS